MHRYVLRDIRPADHEPLYLLHRAALGSYVEAIYGAWDDEVQRQFHARWLAATSGQVIEIAHELVGVIDVETIGDNDVNIGRIEIDPKRQSNGLGTAVLSDLLARVDTATLEVIDINPARRLYERLGFRETHRVGRKIHMRRPASRTH
jgi:ribosomal protein S18 acetylase RimI-like enzyme